MKSRFLVLIAGVLLLNACDKKLDIDPRQSIADDVALNNAQGINNALNSVYAAMKATSLYGRDLLVISDALSDRTFSNGRGNRFVNENQNATNAPFGFWGASYSALNEVNLILEAIPGVTADAALRARWEGELSFMRALLHFNLAITYAYIPSYTIAAQDRGNVILSTKGFKTAEASINYFPTRATNAAVYGLIMSDLYKAIAQLSNANRGVYYASKLSALALGSRVALYEGNWARADSFATAAITLGGIGAITTTANHVAGWRTPQNPESIFEVRIATLNEAPSIATGIQGALTNLVTVGNNTTSNGGFGPLIANQRLLTELGMTFSPAPNASTLSFGTTIPTITRSGDVRNQLFEIGPNVSGRFIECTKFLGKNGAPGVDNIPVLRWAELYLNRAEARSKLSTPDIAGANSDLNFIRTRRVTGFTVPANITGTALMDSIAVQRSLEFAFEGYRWFDMKRWGLPIVKTTPAVNLPNTTFRYNNQIPTAEVDGNKNMVQNFGY